MQYRHFQNYTIITCYTYYGTQNWGKRNATCSFVFAMLLVNSLYQSEINCNVLYILAYVTTVTKRAIDANIRWVYLLGFNTLASGCFWGFSKKKRLNARGFAREYLHSCSGYGPGRSVKRRGKSSSLHSKKIFCLRGADFLSVTS